MTNPTLEALAARKSVRVFTDEAVTPAEKAAILNAAFTAPTAGNQQMYTILDITDPAQKARLAVLCDHQAFIADAPLVLVFVADCARWPAIYRAAGLSPRRAGVGDLLLAVTDTAIAAQNTVLAAESLGLGSCYIGDILENCAAVRAALSLPDQTMPAALLVYGHPTAQQAARKKPARFAASHIVCENRYTAQTPQQLRAAVDDRAAREEAPGYEFERAMQAFMTRKYESGFSREMTRSVAEYLESFETEL